MKSNSTVKALVVRLRGNRISALFRLEICLFRLGSNIRLERNLFRPEMQNFHCMNGYMWYCLRRDCATALDCPMDLDIRLEILPEVKRSRHFLTPSKARARKCACTCVDTFLCLTKYTFGAVRPCMRATWPLHWKHSNNGPLHRNPAERNRIKMEIRPDRSKSGPLYAAGRICFVVLRQVHPRFHGPSNPPRS